MRLGLILAALLPLGAAPPLHGAGPVAAQSVLERSPNVEGVWAGRGGTLYFHTVHRFRIPEGSINKVVNSPTLLVAAGLPWDVLAGLRYGSNSPQVPGAPNEWEVFARWAPLADGSGAPVELAAQAGWNGAAESADGEVVVARSLGRLKVLAGARAFSALAGGEAAAAWVAGGRVRLTRHTGVSADLAGVVGADAPDAAWSAGLQLEIPYTPHSLSLHASNAYTTTLQGASVGREDWLWGFEFTVPVTLSRYFGGRAPAAAAAGDGGTAPAAEGQSDTVVVEMDNRLRFLPDTVRIRAGQTVVWRNTSDVVHTVTADPSLAVRPENVRLPAGAEPFDSGDLVPGGEFRHRFEVAGEYVYFCIPHELAGMTGVVIVEP